MTQKIDSDSYKQKKHFFNSLLTIYGRKPVLEALEDKSIDIYKLHLSDSNKPQGIVADIIAAAEKRNIDIDYHDKKALSRISKNGKQDQGVAADIQLKQYLSIEQFIEQSSAHSPDKPLRLIALDSITNPQNLGMIIRSVTAGNIDGLIIPQKGCAALSSLVVKASTGTLFRAPLLYSETLYKGLTALKNNGATICTLSSHATQSLFEHQAKATTVYVLGNETKGVSKEVEALSDSHLMIPMNNNVESLNVAITAALIAFN